MYIYIYSLGGYDDQNLFEDYEYGWRSIFNQKTPLVCYKKGSDEIVGVNWTFVECKDDQFFENISAIVKSQANCVMKNVKLFRINLISEMFFFLPSNLILFHRAKVQQ